MSVHGERVGLAIVAHDGDHSSPNTFTKKLVLKYK